MKRNDYFSRTLSHKTMIEVMEYFGFEIVDGIPMIETLEKWDELEKYTCYSDYNQSEINFQYEIIKMVSRKAINRFANAYADETIRKIPVEEVASEATLRLPDYLNRLHSFANFQHCFRSCVLSATHCVVMGETGHDFMRINRKDENGNKYADYTRISEQSVKIDDEGHIIDSWDTTVNSDGLHYSYMVDTAEQAVRNITTKRFYETLNDKDKQTLHLLKKGLNHSQIAIKMGVSHTAVGRRVHRLEKQFIKELQG